MTGGVGNGDAEGREVSVKVTKGTREFGFHQFLVKLLSFGDDVVKAERAGTRPEEFGHVRDGSDVLLEQVQGIVSVPEVGELVGVDGDRSGGEQAMVSEFSSAAGG